MSCSADMEDEMEEVNISSEKDEMEEVEQVESCSLNNWQQVPMIWEWEKRDNLNSQLVLSTFQIALAIKSDEFVGIRRQLVKWLTKIGNEMQWNKKQWFTLHDPLQMLKVFETQLNVLEQKIDREESGKIVVKKKPLADALVQFIFSETTNYELYGEIIKKCKQYHAEDSDAEMDTATLRKLADNPLRHVTELILLCEKNKLAELFNYLAGKILQNGDAIRDKYKKDVPMNRNVPIKPETLSRLDVLRDVPVWCVFNSVAIELDDEYKTMLNELRTARLEALLADAPDPLSIMYPNIYMYANFEDMYAKSGLTWYSRNLNGATEIDALVQKLA